MVVLSIHMDDPIAVGPRGAPIQAMEEIRKHVRLKIGEEVKPGQALEYVGRNYRRLVGGGFRIESLPGYHQDTLELAGMKNCKPIGTPGMNKTLQEADLDLIPLNPQESWLFSHIVGRNRTTLRTGRTCTSPRKRLAETLGRRPRARSCG
jgi:hypothetical protein